MLENGTTYDLLDDASRAMTYGWMDGWMDRKRATAVFAVFFFFKAIVCPIQQKQVFACHLR